MYSFGSIMSFALTFAKVVKDSPLAKRIKLIEIQVIHGALDTLLVIAIVNFKLTTVNYFFFPRLN